MPILAIVVGLGMIVGATAFVVWQKEQKVTITPTVTVVSNLADVSLYPGETKPYSIAVTNPTASSVQVALSCTSDNVGVTATFIGTLVSIDAGATYTYAVAVTASVTASGSATLTYTLTQS